MYTLTVKNIDKKTEIIKIIRKITNESISDISAKLESHKPVLILDSLVFDNIKTLIDVYKKFNAIGAEVEIKDDKYNRMITFELLTNRYQMFLDEMNDPNAMH